MPKVLAAVVQTGTEGIDAEATLAKAEQLIAECGARGVKVAVFPEAFIGGYPKGANFHIVIGSRLPVGRDEYAAYVSRAVVVPGPEVTRLGDAARKAELFLVIGVIEREGGTLYCTALFFGPDGSLLGKHRKTMPTAAERLCWGFGDGSTLTTVPTPWGPLGAVICWENYMPLLRTAMYSKGIALYCAPTADDRDSWAATMRHIALEGRCFVLSACQYLTRDNFPVDMQNAIPEENGDVLMRGGSLIVSPSGQILAGPVFDSDAILTAELDLEDVIRGKFDFDVTGHYARPDLFNLTVDERMRRPVTHVQDDQASLTPSS
ncbi:nitrilase [Ancylobacter sp. Lp-2]|uniref:nitrilase-related carbon-nitrogen hydrolase n=1 Tax=Ancylobacter sp. Lp-2 TaxID=2881339 RepID=UPI001E526B28|nr:nitrilase-related carbon-nitrogen hydrolase [Ancylobacter sp. Lp-2]MCB4767042.1 nitrilase [Ancylobacter sp. Lp-2]